MKFLIIGNDARMKALAEMLVMQFADTKLASEPSAQDIEVAEYIILPPKYSGFDIIGKSAKKGAMVFGEVPEGIGIASFNYLEDEEFAQRNAEPTASAAMQIAIDKTGKLFKGARCLVLGCGRIGKILVRELAEVEAEVDTYDIIFNTVPERVLDDEAMERIDEKQLVIDLASDPGGGFPNGLRALSLPSKYAPETAAEIMRDVILREIKKKNKITVGFALTGSFCTIPDIFTEIEKLVNDGMEVVPIVSEAVAQTDTRFGTAMEFLARLREICGHEVISTVTEAEPIGPKRLLDVLVVAPCTGNTLAKIAGSVTDSSVTMAAKAHLRNGRPIVLGISTNDGLSGNMKNIGELMNRKNVFLVPFGQDDAEKKPNSLVADMGKIGETIEAAMEGRQVQPVLK
jgi:dipicolinate synthase subunit B